MKVEVVGVGSYQKKIQFSVPATAVKEELDKAYRVLAKRVRLPGFRPGKAPRKVLEMRFGAQVVDDVAATLVQQGYTDAISEHDIEPVSRPVVDRGDLIASEDFEFTITVDVKPDIELEHYTGVDVVYPEVAVLDEEIDAAVAQRLAAHSRLVTIEDRPVQPGDVVMTELVVADGEEELVREPGTMIRTEGELFYTGVEAMLEGMEIGAEKTERIAFAETARAEGVAGRELDVTLKVVSIQASEVPELSEELLEEMGVEGGETGLRESIRAQIAGSREEFSRNQARANLLQALIDANPFEMPANMIEEQLKMLMDELRLQEAYRGRDPRTVSFSEAQIADLRTRAEFAAKAGLILEHVAKVEELGVGDNEIEAKYHQLAEERGQSVEAIRGYFVKDDAVDELRARLLEEKTLDWLLERATLVSPEDAAADEPDDAEAGTDEAGTDEAGEE